MSTLEVRDLILVEQAALQTLAERGNAVLLAWAADWLAPGLCDWQPDVSVDCSNVAALDLPESEWLSTSPQAAGSRTAWAMAASPVVKAKLAGILLGQLSGGVATLGDWAIQTAEDALHDLNLRMLGAEVEAGGSQPDLTLYSGVTLLQDRKLGLSWVWAPVRHQFNPTPEALTPLNRGLRGQKVCLIAGLGEVEVSVAELLALQPGDVLCFPDALHGPVHWSIEHATVPVPRSARADLGQVDGHVAIRLTSAP